MLTACYNYFGNTPVVVFQPKNKTGRMNSAFKATNQQRRRRIRHVLQFGLCLALAVDLKCVINFEYKLIITDISNKGSVGDLDTFRPRPTLQRACVIMPSIRKFIDIGANLTDSMYNGVYHGSKKHDPDLQFVLNRAWESGLQKIIVTGGSLQESQEALMLAHSDEKLYSTIGCHPTRCGQIEASGDSNAYLASMVALAQEGKGKVVAIGECGLDYDRLEFCSKETQKRYFEAQLTAFNSLELPLFLHCRNAAGDLVEILTRYQDKLMAGGVIHSFDGSKEDATAILNLGYHIGINGCSLKTESNLSVVSFIPVDRLLLETDSPWCEIRPTHAGFKFVTSSVNTVKKEKWQSSCGVKGRNEPMNIRQVLEIVAAVKGEDPDRLCQAIYENTNKLFFPNDKGCTAKNI